MSRSINGIGSVFSIFYCVLYSSRTQQGKQRELSVKTGLNNKEGTILPYIGNKKRDLLLFLTFLNCYSTLRKEKYLLRKRIKNLMQRDLNPHLFGNRHTYGHHTYGLVGQSAWTVSKEAVVQTCQYFIQIIFDYIHRTIKH